MLRRLTLAAAPSSSSDWFDPTFGTVHLVADIGGYFIG
jgi:hypothetical protein